jgi:hypothetical protein
MAILLPPGINQGAALWRHGHAHISAIDEHHGAHPASGASLSINITEWRECSEVAWACQRQTAKRNRPMVEEGEACFQQALAVARHQQAEALELRAATSLSRLWQRQGKRADARQLLAPIYSWFAEGVDTADLQEAQVLLSELS